MEPKLKKSKKVTGNSLVFRNAKPSDAEFILSLRTNTRLSKHLSETDPDVSSQQTWLKNYSNCDDQVYFIIEDKVRKPIGTVRLYDAKADSFCWGSWIIIKDAPKNTAIESALMVYSYAIEYLGFQRSHFDVRKGNERVWRFHERFGAERTGERELDYLYKISYKNITASRHRYNKFLPEPVVVEE